MTEIPETSYPPAPWRSSGQLWTGLFTIDSALQLPEGVSHFLGPNKLMISIVRYTEGTLIYDEFIAGPVVRRGPFIGILVEHIWVNNESSLRGGRSIWGMPKQMAEFTWNDDCVRITDEKGLVAVLNVGRHICPIPCPWMPAPGFGKLNEKWAFTTAHLSGWIGKSGLVIREWSYRFNYIPDETPVSGIAMNPFRMTVMAPRIL